MISLYLSALGILPNTIDCHPCVKVEKPTTCGLVYWTRDQWEVDNSTVKEFVPKLGCGHFEEVWQGLWNNTTPVAMKTSNQEQWSRKTS
ncbi:unnamed protein product [Cyprideis torosa]|uniref:Uncharacterized protein n=1 Tax=Cyprideis torosa TaxID=163714 RepID=A0A7R8ZRY2_9CRUS|nr:unnamed protein product [Cyprideis torosa]CAG0904794.1 unnamed protein product [Cyprideis torosa]